MPEISMEGLCIRPLTTMLSSEKNNAVLQRIINRQNVIGGVTICDMIRYKERFFLLFDSTADVYVGYATIRENKIENVFYLEAFEIFFEFRGSGYGSEFARRIVFGSEWRESGKSNCTVVVCQILDDAMLFWWRALGGEYFVDLVWLSLDTTQDKRSIWFDKWLRKHQKNSDSFASKIFRIICKCVDLDLATLGRCRVQDIAAYVERLELFSDLLKMKQMC